MFYFLFSSFPLNVDVTEELWILAQQLQHVIKRYHKVGYHNDPEVFCLLVQLRWDSLRSVFKSSWGRVRHYFPKGDLTDEMGVRYQRKVKGCPGYFHLLPSTNEEYLRPDIRHSLQNPDRYTEELINYLNVFRDTSKKVANTDDMKHCFEI